MPPITPNSATDNVKVCAVKLNDNLFALIIHVIVSVAHGFRKLLCEPYFLL